MASVKITSEVFVGCGAEFTNASKVYLSSLLLQ